VANYLNIDQYEKDCARLSYLTNGIVDDISLLGGEPLLNENIISIMKITRKYFHTGMIRIFTNGTLLLTQIDDFWRALNEYDIKLYISVYPIRLNHEKIREKASEFDVDIVYDGDVEHVTKTWRKMPIDISGNQNGRKSFAKCPVSNYCMQLVNGKIYPCFRIAYIPIFNKVFSQNLVVSDKDYIDIYKINNLKEILEFCRRPIPFCKYCNMKKIKIVKWAPTKKSISEWIEES
jgi:MoaA/NifB/PqqE/SkfB family radical SAM enzyme